MGMEQKTKVNHILCLFGARQFRIYMWFSNPHDYLCGGKLFWERGLGYWVGTAWSLDLPKTLKKGKS